MKSFKDIAISAVSKSGKILKKKYEEFDRTSVMFKTNHEILTENDLLSEKIIINEIKKYFSEHEILSEEFGKNKNKSDYLWIIDPIDGTTNFSMHNPLWSISVALAYKGKIILGVIYAPILNELFVAEKGMGAYLNNKKIKPSNIYKGKTLNAFCHGKLDDDIKRAIKYFNIQKIQKFDCRQMGSACIEFAYVACGRIESIVIPGANAWDVAAGALMVSEAGGQVSDFKGKSWNLKSYDIVASNKKTHKDLLFILKNI